MFWEASKFNAPPLTRPFSQQASRSFCNCSWSTSVLSWPVAMEYFGQVWKFNYSAAQDWYSCSLAQQTCFFLLDKVDKMLFTGPPHSSTKVSPWRRSSQNTQNGGGLLWPEVHIEKSHTICVTESWMQLLVYFAPFFQPSCNVRRRFLVEKDSYVQ